jgi:hypothetical protein
MFPVLSKSFLQSRSVDSRYDGEIGRIINNVKQAASQGKTRICENNYINHDMTRERLIALLQNYLPEVSIEYVELPRLNGTIEKGIVIDWS